MKISACFLACALLFFSLSALECRAQTSFIEVDNSSEATDTYVGIPVILFPELADPLPEMDASEYYSDDERESEPKAHREPASVEESEAGLLGFLIAPEYFSASITQQWALVLFGPVTKPELHNYVRLGNEGWEIADQFVMDIRLNRFVGLNFKTLTMGTEMYVWECPETGCEPDTLVGRVMNADTGEVGALRAVYPTEWRTLGFNLTVYPFKTNAVSFEAGPGIGCLKLRWNGFGDAPMCNAITELTLRLRPGFSYRGIEGRLAFEAGTSIVNKRPGRWTGVEDKTYPSLGGPDFAAGEHRHGENHRLYPVKISLGVTMGINLKEFRED